MQAVKIAQSVPVYLLPNFPLWERTCYITTELSFRLRLQAWGNAFNKTTPFIGLHSPFSVPFIRHDPAQDPKLC